MKVSSKTQLASQGPTLRQMPEDLQIKLKGKSINEAIKANLITEICNAKGAFIVPHNTVADLYYAIINGNAVICSPGLVEELERLPEMIGDLTFYGGDSQEFYGQDGEVTEDEEKGERRRWFRLGMPYTLDVADNGYGVTREDKKARELELTDENKED